MIKGLTEEQMESILKGMDEHIAKMKKRREEFLLHRFQDALDYILWWTSQNGALGYDVYQEPLLPACKRWPEVTNEEFVEVVSIVLSDNTDRKKEDPDNPFENEIVEAYGREFGVMHGQGSHYWVALPQEDESDT